MGKTGLWLVGARGGVSTTVITGLVALSRGLRSNTGLITEHPVFKNCELPELQEFVIGGHEIRTGSLQESARAIEKDSNSIPGDLIRALSEELDKVDTEIKPGILVNAGEAIQSLDHRLPDVEDMDPGAALTKVVSDLTQFRASNQLDGLVVVVLSSTEAPLPHHPSHDSATALMEAAESGVREAFRSSTIYAMASAQVGASFVNFTPSPAALIPATREMLESHQCAYCGCDGKTGETLVKSALAPMFAQRALNVLTWQSYNMLGDRDGEVLAHEDNRSSKITSKGELIHEILGEGVHSQVSIDYVPSLGDNKTAWDLIHFSGFLDHRMTMQFTWQGCDAILAAPLVIDLARLLETSRRRGESGLQSHCGLFFKSPLDSRTHALGDQFDALISKAKSWGSQL
ncbi:MAG: inositol-3-phosphate synthase [Planctomycetota bacterium]|nr:inositol-3-phosphate synthase [Planctomycetota bacterium]